jgi:hypothetical protein
VLGVLTKTLPHARCQARRRRPELESGNQHVRRLDYDDDTTSVCMTTKEIVLETFTCQARSESENDELLPEARSGSALQFLGPHLGTEELHRSQ